MKIRTAFVANSSSSSYVVFGNRVDGDHIEGYALGRITPKGKLYGYGYGIAVEGDLFELTEEMLEVVRRRGIPSVRGHSVCYNPLSDIYDALAIVEERGTLKKSVPAGTEVHSLEASYHSTASTKDFEDRYYGG